MSSDNILELRSKNKVVSALSSNNRHKGPIPPLLSHLSTKAFYPKQRIAFIQHLNNASVLEPPTYKLSSLSPALSFLLLFRIATLSRVSLELSTQTHNLRTQSPTQPDQQMPHPTADLEAAGPFDNIPLEQVPPPVYPGTRARAQTYAAAPASSSPAPFYSFSRRRGQESKGASWMGKMFCLAFVCILIVWGIAIGAVKMALDRNHASASGGGAVAVNGTQPPPHIYAVDGTKETAVVRSFTIATALNPIATMS